MSLNATHTSAVMEVSQSTFNEISLKLEKAGYTHAFMEDGSVDMHGVAIKAEPPSDPVAKFELYVDEAREHRWRIRAKNGEILATSSEGYKRRIDCIAAIELVARTEWIDIPKS